MPHSETVERILDAAELLFAEKGFAETSLRLITSKAEVNLAAVNYHFGSKKALIQAVFARFLGPFCQALEHELDAYEQQAAGILSLERLLAVLLEQALAIKSRNRGDVSVFMRLLGLAFSERQQDLREYLGHLYGRLFRRYMRLLQCVLPKVPPEALFWRLHFMLGTAIFSLSGLKGSMAAAEVRFNTPLSTEQVLNMMVAFLAAGLRAEAENEVLGSSAHPN